ncbi:MAG: hypothetical protein AB1611_02190 [bacterium]
MLLLWVSIVDARVFPAGKAAQNCAPAAAGRTKPLLIRGEGLFPIGLFFD